MQRLVRLGQSLLTGPEKGDSTMLVKGPGLYGWNEKSLWAEETLVVMSQSNRHNNTKLTVNYAAQ